VALIVDADTEDDDRIRKEELDFQDFVNVLPVETPPIILLGKPDLEASLKDEEWLKKFPLGSRCHQAVGAALVQRSTRF
jgi:hypothetical protein